MSSKKHPLFVVFVILVIAIIFLGMVMAVIIMTFGGTTRLSFGDKIGVITIEGPIKDSGPVLSQLVRFRKDRRIKAIVLRIDSPGGGVGPSQEIYREVRRTRKTKRVIASLGSLAASGGYYVASAADRIVANPGTITGSIGVVMEFLRLEDLMEKIGIDFEVLKSGEFKDIGSPHRKMSQREKELVKGLISDIQRQFVDAVARGRGLEIQRVREIADGRILSGAQAKDLGLVDSLGNFQDALDLAKKMSGIKGEAQIVYPKRPKGRFWDFLFRNATEAVLEALRQYRTSGLEYRWVD
ncbi:MAG: signal peptide peptidase SppA [Deltaproteobacteria bacterium]|nr:signal peptide peptidase SppA [Deltaproteobacteria bacterium]MBW2137506.1 signal peptide peptidase SppA [Deltaproteobacteria bacterium]